MPKNAPKLPRSSTAFRVLYTVHVVSQYVLITMARDRVLPPLVHGTAGTATRKTCGGAAPEPANTCYCPKCACVEYSRFLTWLPYEAIKLSCLFKLHLRSSYALEHQSMEETSEYRQYRKLYTYNTLPTCTPYF